MLDLDLPRVQVLRHFSEVWYEIFSSPVHLDSAISRRPKKYKAILHTLLTTILRRPQSIAHYLQITLQPDEPWRYSLERLASWDTAYVMADRLFKSLRQNPDLLAEFRPYREDFPENMRNDWQKNFGKDTTQSLVELLTEEPSLTLRAARKMGAAEVLRIMQQEKILPKSAKLCRYSPQGIYVPEYATVMHNQLFERGAFEIQDEGSQIMAFFALYPDLYGPLLSDKPCIFPKATHAIELPDAKPLVVIDACAGAGGKALALADAMGGKGRVYAYDISASKLQSLRQRGVRAGVQNIQTLAITAGNEKEQTKKFAQKADIVLVDAPCSGWGVLRRNPDIKWRQDEDALDRMPVLQAHLLDAYSPLVKKGGRLVFGVCTFRQAETKAVVEKFLAAHPEFTLHKSGFFGPHQSDGFFMAAMTKNEK